MAFNAQKLKRTLGDMVPGMRADRRLRRLQDMVHRVDHFTMGSSATYVGNNRVLVRVIAGVHAMILYVHADDKLISPWLIVNGQYEPEVTEYFIRELKPDSHCVDVGANLGYFTCLLAKFCPDGQVISLEPNAPVHALCADNILLNAFSDRARVLNVAASDRAGEVTLYRRVGRDGNTSIAATGDAFTSHMREPPEEAFQVPTVRVDDLRDQLGGRVDFIKIDVEGAEPLAFAGARETIRDNAAVQVVMEWAPAQIRHAGFDIAAFVGEIAEAELRPFLLTGRTPQPISHADLAGLGYQPGVLLRRSAA